VNCATWEPIMARRAPVVGATVGGGRGVGR